MRNGPTNVCQRKASLPKAKRPAVKTKSRLPEFKTIQEEAAFWDSHDLTDYLDEFEQDRETVFVRPEAPLVEVSRTLWPKLVELSKQKHTTPDRLVNRWVREKLSKTG